MQQHRSLFSISCPATWRAALAVSMSLAALSVAAAEGPTAPAPEELPPAASPLPEPTEAESKAAAPAPDSGETEPVRDGRCDACGGCEGVRRVCVPVAVEREKIKVCWSYRCEEICIPGPSLFCGETCESDACGSWWKAWWKPTCARVITRHVPVKNEVKRKVPGFDWQVQERCCDCRGPVSAPAAGWLGCLRCSLGTK